MDRRQFNVISLSVGTLFATLAVQHAHALTLADLSNADATKGLKTALEKGALSAVGILGVTDGFLGNEKVRIPLPGYLEDGAKLLRNFGMGGKVDELITAMNRGAEQAVPFAKDLLVKAVQTMSVTDAKGILSGGDTAVTEFLPPRHALPWASNFYPWSPRPPKKWAWPTSTTKWRVRQLAWV